MTDDDRPAAESGMPTVLNVVVQRDAGDDARQRDRQDHDELTVSRPKNRKRCTAKAASVPSMSAMAVAKVAARIELTNAPGTDPFASARSNQCRREPGDGHDWTSLGVERVQRR